MSVVLDNAIVEHATYNHVHVLSVLIDKCCHLVSCGQTLFLRRGIIAFSTSAPCEKGLVLFTGLTGTGTTIVVGSVNW